MPPREDRRKVRALRPGDGMNPVALALASGIIDAPPARPHDDLEHDTRPPAGAKRRSATSDGPAKELPEKRPSAGGGGGRTDARGAKGGKKETVRESWMRKRVTPDEAEELRLRFESTLHVRDPGTGEERTLDVNTMDDLDYLQDHQGVDVMARTDDEAGNAPRDMTTGMVAMRRERLPIDLNRTSLLPVKPLALAMYLRDNANTVSDVLFFMPLINVPVYTPKLMQLLMLNTATWPTYDSFQLLRRYFAVLQIFYHAPSTRRSVREAFKWLAKRLGDSTLTSDDIDTIARHSRLTVAPNSATPDTGGTGSDGDDASAEGSTDQGAPATSSVNDDGDDDDDGVFEMLQRKFDAHELSEDDIDAARARVAVVDRYEDAPWVPKDAVFGEDVMKDHMLSGIAACNAIGNELDAVEAAEQIEGDIADSVMGILYHYTTRILRTYEVAIMRMLSEASTIRDTIPRKYFGDLASGDEVPKEVEDVHLTVRREVSIGRAYLSHIRAEVAAGRHVERPEPGEDYSDAASKVLPQDVLAGATVFPSADDLGAFVTFVKYHADTEHEFANMVELMQESLHVVEPKEIVKGMPVADVDVADDDGGGGGDGDEDLSTTTTGGYDSVVDASIDEVIAAVQAEADARELAEASAEAEAESEAQAEVAQDASADGEAVAHTLGICDEQGCTNRAVVRGCLPEEPLISLCADHRYPEHDAWFHTVPDDSVCTVDGCDNHAAVIIRGDGYGTIQMMCSEHASAILDAKAQSEQSKLSLTYANHATPADGAGPAPDLCECDTQGCTSPAVMRGKDFMSGALQTMCDAHYMLFHEVQAQGELASTQTPAGDGTAAPVSDLGVCDMQDCTTPAVVRGSFPAGPIVSLCDDHRVTDDAAWFREAPEHPACDVDGCTKPALARSQDDQSGVQPTLCNLHRVCDNAVQLG